MLTDPQNSRGYYEIASSRFVDCICQGVHAKLFFKCREGLVGVIEQKLGFDKPICESIRPIKSILTTPSQRALHGPYGRGS